MLHAFTSHIFYLVGLIIRIRWRVLNLKRIVTGSGLDDWIYWHRIHSTRNYRQYGAVAILHTLQFTITHALGFSVSTSRILATDLSQSHCHFKAHMRPSFHRLIPFLPFLLNPLRLPSPERDKYWLKWTILEPNSLNFWQQLTLLSWTLLYNHFARTMQKAPILLLMRRVYWSVA
jgi:hypothetical protein